jgi:hypothetical protein
VTIEKPIELGVAEHLRHLQRRAAFAIGDARIGAGGKQALHFVPVVAQHSAVQQRVAEGPLVIRVVVRGRHDYILPQMNDKCMSTPGGDGFR